MSDIGISQFDAALVCASSQSSDHIVLILYISLIPSPLQRGTYRNNLARPPLLNDILIEFANLLVGFITSNIDR